MPPWRRLHQHAQFPAAVGQHHEQASRDRFHVTPVIAYHDRTLGIHVSAVDSGGQRLEVVNTEHTEQRMCLKIPRGRLLARLLVAYSLRVGFGFWVYAAKQAASPPNTHTIRLRGEKR
jgi:hypothetical protein